MGSEQTKPVRTTSRCLRDAKCARTSLTIGRERPKGVYHCGGVVPEVSDGGVVEGAVVVPSG